jgi:hypothetical protein
VGHGGLGCLVCRGGGPVGRGGLACLVRRRRGRIGHRRLRRLTRRRRLTWIRRATGRRIAHDVLQVSPRTVLATGAAPDPWCSRPAGWSDTVGDPAGQAVTAKAALPLCRPGPRGPPANHGCAPGRRPEAGRCFACRRDRRLCFRARRRSRRVEGSRGVARASAIHGAGRRCGRPCASSVATLRPPIAVSRGAAWPPLSTVLPAMRRTGRWATLGKGALVSARFREPRRPRVTARHGAACTSRQSRPAGRRCGRPAAAVSRCAACASAAHGAGGSAANRARPRAQRFLCFR